MWRPTPLSLWRGVWGDEYGREGERLNRNTININLNSPESPETAFPPCFSQERFQAEGPLSLPWGCSLCPCCCSSSSGHRYVSVTAARVRSRPVALSIPLSPTVAEVASLLCINSPLTQELFFPVKGTCDKEGGGGNTFSFFPNFKHTFHHWEKTPSLSNGWRHLSLADQRHQWWGCWYMPQIGEKLDWNFPEN